MGVKTQMSKYKSLRVRLMGLLGIEQIPDVAVASPSAEPRPGQAPATAHNLAWARKKKEIEAIQAGPARANAWRELFPVATVPEWVPKHEAVAAAMDSSVENVYAYASGGQFGEGITWPGYPYLAELTQRPEYRIFSEVRAEEMTRKGIELTYTGDEDKTEQLAELEAAFKEFGVLAHLRKAAELDGFFGRTHIYIDTGASLRPQELNKPLLLVPEKIPKGSVKGFQCIEPMWMYPAAYNSDRPLLPDFFKPQHWYVMGQTVHSSRLIQFTSREMPDILKPAYSFGGLSISQILKPYVDWWLQDRNAVSDLVTNFSIVVWLTNMAASNQAGSSLTERADFFNAARSNQGLFVADMDTEDVKNLAVPLGTLDALQAQSQEHMLSVARTPAVKAFGVEPAGLNPSSDGTIRVYYDSIHGLQEKIFCHPLDIIMKVIQLHLWGKIDPGFGYKFQPLWQLDEAEQAAVRKSDADTAAVYVQEGIIAPEEVRNVLASDQNSPYAGIKADDLPEVPEDDDGEVSVSGNPAKSAEPKRNEASGE